ncbi:hypothetical protein PG984_010696 [Apiospora sp. TS-2023a]
MNNNKRRRWWDPDPQLLEPFIRPQPDRRADEADPYFLAARATSRQVRQAFDYTQFIFKKTLGWGGFGLALKFEQVDANQQHVAYAAVKVPLAANPKIEEAFEDEMRFYMRFEVSEHIPRLMHYPSDLTEEQEDGTRALPVGNDQFWAQDKTGLRQVHFAMIVEYLEYADFYELIYKLTDAYYENSLTQGTTTSKKTEAIPNRTMWRFFLCSRTSVYLYTEFQVERMIKSQQNPQSNGRSSVAIEDQAWREEVDEDLVRSRLIHKDLDPGNADFGVMYDAAKPHPDIEDILRRGGKDTWHAPEQFEDDVYKGQESFGAWTNIYGVGLLMLALMTRAIWETSSRVFREVPTPTPTDPDRTCESYGWHLDETLPWPEPGRSDQVTSFLNDYEKDLRVLVMQCLARWPKERPTLEELVQTIEAAIKRGDELEAQGASGERETDAKLEEFYDQFFRSAPEKPDPWEGMYGNPHNRVIT